MEVAALTHQTIYYINWAKKAEEMMEDKLERANKRLQDARDDLDKHLEKAQVEEKRLRDRLHHLDEQKRECADANGNLDTSDDDVIEINAGGKIFAVRRGVLCQIKGTKLEALFSGRWDKKLLRDGSGHVFLDVNPKAFRAIIDWLNMLAISSPEERVRMPTVDAECKHLLKHQMELFVEGGVTESANKSDGTSGDKEDGSAKTAGVGANDCVFGRLSEKWVTLKELKADTLSLEKSFNKEEKFIETFFGGKQDVGGYLLFIIKFYCGIGQNLWSMYRQNQVIIHDIYFGSVLIFHIVSILWPIGA